jgi:DNA-binding transcriptional MocR family regulator
MLQYNINNNMSRNVVVRGSTADEIAASIERALQAGAFKEEGRLPSIRSLSASLKVSPVTVAAAYKRLHDRGLAHGQGRGGTRLRPGPAGLTSSAAPALLDQRLVDLASGNPDPALLPSLAGALRTVGVDHHLYGGPPDLPALAAFAAGEFAADGIPSGEVCVTSGGLDAIERVVREHTRAGDRVAVEDPTFPALLDVLASLGVTPVPCSVDEEGPRPDSFARALGQGVRVAIVTSRAHNPTGAAITETRAADLSRLLRSRPETLLLEIDDAGAVSGAPLVTLTGGRPAWAVVRSTSKFLGPDLRVAVMAGDAMTIARVQRRQAIGVRWVSHLLQRVALALWSDPSSGRLLARAADVYAERRKALIDALAATGISAHGRSGLNVWIPVREETTTVQALAGRGWAVAAGERFRLQSPPAIRVTTAALTPEDAQRFAADLAASARPAAASRG